MNAQKDVERTTYHVPRVEEVECPNCGAIYPPTIRTHKTEKGNIEYDACCKCGEPLDD